MKKILLPTDFSENSYNALKYAVQLFKGEPCVFFLLHTYAPVLYNSEYMLHSLSEPDLTNSYQENSVQKMERFTARIIKEFPNKHHEFTKISSFNNLGEEIKEQVINISADLVIMGTKGATGAKKLLFGSNTVYAMHKIACPLLAVPAEHQFKPPKEILFPTDYEVHFNSDLLQILFEVVDRNDSCLNVLHVDLDRGLSEDRQKQRTVLKRHLYNRRHVFHLLPGKELLQTIQKFGEDHAVDLLVMINNKHSFLEDLLFRPLVDEIGYNLKLPFLVLPSKTKKHTGPSEISSGNSQNDTYTTDSINY